MARKLKKWPKKYTSHAQKNNRKHRYPWAEWMDGSIWEAERGKDFFTSVRQFQVALHQRVFAVKDTYYLKTRRTGPNSLTFCFILQDEAWLEEDEGFVIPFGPDEEDEG